MCRDGDPGRSARAGLNCVGLYIQVFRQLGHHVLPAFVVWCCVAATSLGDAAVLQEYRRVRPDNGGVQISNKCSSEEGLNGPTHELHNERKEMEYGNASPSSYKA